MNNFNVILNNLFPILKYLFIIAFIVDNMIIYYLVKNEIVFDHEYYKFHTKMGVKRISLIKLVAGLFIIICFISPPLTVYNFLILTILYILYILKMLISFIFNQRKI